ncbi:MAG: hypothetical protein KJ893_10965 [Candidatus Omnitrophica bacterium]|nr:hypothetical protein [Candidatus Omnitrophota bacterium]MBU4479740.1 hypothetical protein [Candidatus Omnitrophota bacterium]
MNENKETHDAGEDVLIAKLQRIEALFAGTNYEGEKAAAKNALDRIRERLRKIREIDPPVEFKFSMGDMWSRRLFVALCRRYGIDTYRYSGQKYTTVMALVSKSFIDKTLWPEFQELDDTLRSYIDTVTNRVIKETIHKDSSEVEVRQEKRLLSNKVIKIT